MDSLLKLSLTHGWLVEEILRAIGYFLVDNWYSLSTLLSPLSTKIIIHTDIDDAQLKTMLATEHIHATATMRKVDHLLPGHLSGRHTDTLTLNTVIASEEQMTGVSKTWRE